MASHSKDLRSVNRSLRVLKHSLARNNYPTNGNNPEC